ncbi:MAG: hypothetical protein Q4D28_01475 [Prevotellaceae bacterium]|nr:hypothetical protein [Prevotellaceae bacterium]
MVKDNTNKTVTIAGKVLALRMMERNELKGVFTDALLTFSFYAVEYMENHFVLLESKTSSRLTPVQCKKLTENLSDVLGKPCVMMFGQLASYERNRYIEHGVYFVVSGKYVYLPFLLINARDSAPVNKERLQPAAQYILMCHLQKKNLNGNTLADLEKLLPYSYLAISRAVRQLEATMLADVSVSSNGTKSIYFHKEGKALWEEAEPLMQNPVKMVWYADEEVPQGLTGGINALSYYSDLNPETLQTKVMYDADFRKARDIGELPELNRIEGYTRIEVWKYPPVIHPGQETVDRLSLALSLREDKDPRVEKEIELMIKKLW